MGQNENGTVRIRRAVFRNFKALREFSIALEPANILVGPNNAGKSTILDAARVLAAGLRYARARSSGIVDGPEGFAPGYVLPEEAVPTSLENVHTDYVDKDTTVEFHLSNGRKLSLYFPRRGGCRLLPDFGQCRNVRPSEFRNLYPIEVGVVPVLGPVDHKEVLVERETVQRALTTRRASLHFRNFWHHYPDSFDEFASLVAESWPSMEIERPELDYGSTKPQLTMFCKENRMTRELYWAGFGFQVWCQLLTHIIRSRGVSLLVVDEPEIYLHPDVQRQLLRILLQGDSDLLLATHSTEIVEAADPHDIVIVDKEYRSAKRISKPGQVQTVMELLGSCHNVALSQLARNPRLVFVESAEDAKLLLQFAEKLGSKELATGGGMTFVPLGGARLDRLKTVAWSIQTLLQPSLSLAVILDRDYSSEFTTNTICSDLQRDFSLVHVHARKEIENYLLIPSAIDRALVRLLADRTARIGGTPAALLPAHTLLDEAILPVRSDCLSQYIARAQESGGANLDAATLAKPVVDWFDRMWADPTLRINIVPGKKVLSRLCEIVQERWKVTLTKRVLLQNMYRQDVADDMRSLIRALDRFRTTGGFTAVAPSATVARAASVPAASASAKR